MLIKSHRNGRRGVRRLVPDEATQTWSVYNRSGQLVLIEPFDADDEAILAGLVKRREQLGECAALIAAVAIPDVRAALEKVHELLVATTEDLLG